MKIKDIVKEVVRTLIKEYKPEKIILYGSYRCGKSTDDSDIDLLIIKDTKRSSRVDRFVEVKRIIYNPKIKIPISPLVLTPDELKERLHIGDDFLKEIITKGKILYERKDREKMV